MKGSGLFVSSNRTFFSFTTWYTFHTKSLHRLQGVPKVRSSYFMRQNCWSKLYFYMKTSKRRLLLYWVHVFRSSISGILPFVFLSRSVAVVAWSGMSHLAQFFNTVLAVMTSERHSEDRIKTSKQRTVATVYTLCYGLNQVCNWLMTENVIFLHQSNLNQYNLDNYTNGKVAL